MLFVSCNNKGCGRSVPKHLNISDMTNCVPGTFYEDNIRGYDVSDARNTCFGTCIVYNKGTSQDIDVKLERNHKSTSLKHIHKKTTTPP
jgi:hypothetical protein